MAAQQHWGRSLICMALRHPVITVRLFMLWHTVCLLYGILFPFENATRTVCVVQGADLPHRIVDVCYICILWREMQWKHFFPAFQHACTLIHCESNIPRKKGECYFQGSLWMYRQRPHLFRIRAVPRYAYGRLYRQKSFLVSLVRV